jgi:hypothetical protein
MASCQDCLEKYSCNFPKGSACKGFVDYCAPRFEVVAVLAGSGQRVGYGLYKVGSRNMDQMVDCLQKQSRFSYVLIEEV